VPLANPEQSENMGLAHFPQSPPVDVRSAARVGWRPLVSVPGTHRSSVRKPGPPPWDSVPHYLLRGRDRIFGDDFTKQVQDMGVKEVLSSPRSPWQRAYVERLIGSIR
jgi:hypothetical protein